MRKSEILYGQPWQIRPDVWHRFHKNCLATLEGHGPILARTDSLPIARRPLNDAYGDALPQLEMRGKLAIVPVSGAMVKGASGFDKWAYSVTSHEDIDEDIDAALAKGATTFLFNMNSPGGTVCGTPELASRIADLEDQGKSTAAFTSDLCCSAAYYAVAGCGALFCTPSAVVGSIGTIWETMNVADWLAKVGIEYNVFTSGPYKGSGHPAKKLTDDQKAWMQSMVDQMSQEFKGHVTQFRKAVGPDTMQGQIFKGSEAAANGLFDANVSGLSEVISLLR